MDLKAFLLALEAPARLALAGRCGTSYGQLRQVAYGARRAGAQLAIAIERESGGVVRCEGLRPDVDWAYLRASRKEAA